MIFDDLYGVKISHNNHYFNTIRVQYCSYLIFFKSLKSYNRGFIKDKNKT